MQFYWKSSQANPIYREREGTKWLFEVNGDNLSNKCLFLWVEGNNHYIQSRPWHTLHSEENHYTT